jgi:hypothetical protein
MFALSVFHISSTVSKAATKYERKCAAAAAAAVVAAVLYRESLQWSLLLIVVS